MSKFCRSSQIKKQLPVYDAKLGHKVSSQVCGLHQAFLLSAIDHTRAALVTGVQPTSWLWTRHIPPTNCSSLETSVPGLPLKQAQCKRTVRPPPPCHILQKSIYIKMDSTRAEKGGPRGGIQGQAREPTARRGRWDTHLRLAGRSSLSDSLLQHPHDREANSCSSQNPAMSK